MTIYRTEMEQGQRILQRQYVYAHENVRRDEPTTEYRCYAIDSERRRRARGREREGAITIENV